MLNDKEATTKVRAKLEDDLERAISSLDEISRTDIASLRRRKNLTGTIKKILEAVVICTKREPVHRIRGRKAGSVEFWPAAEVLLNSGDFTQELMSIKVKKIPLSRIAFLRDYFMDPLLDKNLVEKLCPPAAVILWKWACAVYVYKYFHLNKRDRKLLDKGRVDNLVNLSQNSTPSETSRGGGVGIMVKSNSSSLVGRRAKSVKSRKTNRVLTPRNKNLAEKPKSEEKAVKKIYAIHKKGNIHSRTVSLNNVNEYKSKIPANLDKCASASISPDKSPTSIEPISRTTSGTDIIPNEYLEPLYEALQEHDTSLGNETKVGLVQNINNKQDMEDWFMTRALRLLRVCNERRDVLRHRSRSVDISPRIKGRRLRSASPQVSSSYVESLKFRLSTLPKIQH